MKKILIIATIALAALTTYALTSQQPAQQSKTTTAKTTKTAPKTKAAAAQTRTASPKNQGVIKLTDDTKYRPGMKVKRLTVLDFNATWCGPCKQFAPAFQQAAAKYGAKADFVSIDTDANPNTAKAFSIQAIPTVIFLMPDGTTKRYVGTEDILPAERFLEMVQKAL